MHELSLLNDLMGKIQTVAKEQGARKIVKLTIWLGVLSHFSASHFKQHFDEASVGTVAEGAELEVELSEDIHDPNAQSILLKDIEVEK